MHVIFYFNITAASERRNRKLSVTCQVLIQPSWNVMWSLHDEHDHAHKAWSDFSIIIRGAYRRVFFKLVATKMLAFLRCCSGDIFEALHDHNLLDFAHFQRFRRPWPVLKVRSFRSIGEGNDRNTACVLIRMHVSSQAFLPFFLIQNDAITKWRRTNKILFVT